MRRSSCESFSASLALWANLRMTEMVGRHAILDAGVFLQQFGQLDHTSQQVDILITHQLLRMQTVAHFPGRKISFNPTSAELLWKNLRRYLHFLLFLHNDVYKYLKSFLIEGKDIKNPSWALVCNGVHPMEFVFQKLRAIASDFFGIQTHEGELCFARAPMIDSISSTMFFSFDNFTKTLEITPKSS